MSVLELYPNRRSKLPKLNKRSDAEAIAGDWKKIINWEETNEI